MMLDNVAIASITPQYLSLVRVEIIINSYRNFLLFTSHVEVRTYDCMYCYFSHHPWNVFQDRWRLYQCVHAVMENSPGFQIVTEIKLTSWRVMRPHLNIKSNDIVTNIPVNIYRYFLFYFNPVVALTLTGHRHIDSSRSVCLFKEPCPLLKNPNMVLGV